MRVSIVTFLLVACCAYARVGETLAQLQERFGAATADTSHANPPPGVSYQIFSKNGVRIHATLIDDRCVWINYHQGIPGMTVSRKLTKQEIDDLLKANGDGQRWLDNDDISLKRSSSKLSFRKDPTSWKRADRKMFAKLSSDGHSITITAADYDKLMAEARKKSSVSGF